MEIANWDKLNGQKFDVMGASFIMMDAKIDGNIYSVWMHPFSHTNELVRITLFSDTMNLQLKVIPPIDYNVMGVPIDLTTTIDKLHVSNPSIFIQTIAEGLLDDPTVRDIISFVSRKQDNATRFKGRGYTQLTGANGSSGFGGNNLW